MATVPDHPLSYHFMHRGALFLHSPVKTTSWRLPSRDRAETRAASLPKEVVLVCWSAWAACIAFLTCAAHFCDSYVISHVITMDISPKPSASFHLLQRFGGLHWEHKAQLQSKVRILKSTFVYIWVTVGITSLQDTVQICRNLLPRSQYLRKSVLFPWLGEHQGDSRHSQTAITRMFVLSHHFFEADLIYLWPVYVGSSLYKLYFSGLPSDSSAPSKAKSGCSQLSPGATACFCLLPPAAMLLSELCNCVTAQSALKPYVTPVSLWRHSLEIINLVSSSSRYSLILLT